MRKTGKFDLIDDRSIGGGANSLFSWRSRSLNGKDQADGSKTRYKKMNQKQEQSEWNKQTGRRRTASMGRDYEREKDTGEANGISIGWNIGRFRRRLSQPALIRTQTNGETTNDEQKKPNGTKKKRSIVDPISKKLSFLRRRPTETALLVSQDGSAVLRPASTGVTGSVNQKLPTKQEIQNWASSFEDLLSNQYGVVLFRLFLKQEISEENIDFWMACEEYKRIGDHDQLTNTAKQIYTDYVAAHAPKEVNLDSVTRGITAAGCINPTTSTFQQAQHRIQSLMEKDSYPRFLRSHLYLNLVKKY